MNEFRSRGRVPVIGNERITRPVSGESLTKETHVPLIVTPIPKRLVFLPHSHTLHCILRHFCNTT